MSFRFSKFMLKALTETRKIIQRPQISTLIFYLKKSGWRVSNLYFIQGFVTSALIIGQHDMPSISKRKKYISK